MTLEEVRAEIDRVDQQIRKLFQERMELADQVAQVKAQTGDAILKPDREAAMIKRLTEKTDPKIRKEYTAMLKRIIQVSREHQYRRTLELRADLSPVGKNEGQDPVMFAPELTVRPEHNRIRIRFVCPNQGGALAAVLSVISDYEVNLTEIHSRPDQREKWKNEFYAELSGNLRDQELQALIFQLSKETEGFRILESYYCPDEGGMHIK